MVRIFTLKWSQWFWSTVHLIVFWENLFIKCSCTHSIRNLHPGHSAPAALQHTIVHCVRCGNCEATNGKKRIRKTTEGFVVRQCYSRIDKRTDRIVYSFVCDRRTAIDKVFLFPAKCNCIFRCCCSYFHIELIQMNSKRITVFCRKICFQKYSNWNVCGVLVHWHIL